MDRYYQPIDGRNIAFDKDAIADVFGAAGDVIASKASYLGTTIEKYAFYNTGELCEVLVTNGNPVICVRVHGHRRKEILNWLKQYLKNGMAAAGWETDIPVDNDDYFYARFYEEPAE